MTETTKKLIKNETSLNRSKRNQLAQKKTKPIYSNSPIIFNDFTNEETFFYNSNIDISRQKNATSTVTLPRKPTKNNNIKTSNTFTNMKMSLVTITQKTILSTLRESSETKSYPRYFSPPKPQEPSESEERADTQNSYNYNPEELYKTYDPEIGIRIAIALGSMILLLILYLIWENSCSPSRHVKLDMEFWLNYVDKKKLKKQKREQANYSFDSIHSLELPDQTDTSNQATANWILEHAYLINEMPKIPNKYYLTELNTRHENNNLNKELLLFKDKIEFKTSYEELMENSSLKRKLFSFNSGSKKFKNLSEWYTTTFKGRRANEVSPSNFLDVKKRGSFKKERKIGRNLYQRRSWPDCNNDFQMCSTRNQFRMKASNQRKLKRKHRSKQLQDPEETLDKMNDNITPDNIVYL